MRNQKRKQEKFDINKVSRKKVIRKMTTENALKIAIGNSRAIAKQIDDWIHDVGKSDDCVIILRVEDAEDIKTHVFMWQKDNNTPFPMIMYGVPSSLDGVIEEERHDLEQIVDSIDPKLIEDGLVLEIVTTMDLQTDRRDSLLNAVEKYTEVLKFERKKHEKS